MDDWTTSDLELPGFRFHPTEEELLEFYLRNMVFGKKLHYSVIGYVNIYHHDPWDLPGLAKIGEREWYFFVPRDRKHGSGGRPNRTTRKGFWKATGSDRKITSSSNPKKMIGLKKTLVFYQGRAPRGCKTDWVMNEYRLPDDTPADTCRPATDSNAVVLCKIYRKATSLRVLEQRAALDQRETQALVHDDAYASGGPSSPPMDAVSVCNIQHDQVSFAITRNDHRALKKEDEELSGIDKKHINSTSTDDDDDDDHDSLKCKDKSKTCTNHLCLPTTTPSPMGKAKNLAELQVPKLTMDWTQDPFWTQLRSPWLDNLTTPNYHANVLNF